MKQRFSYLDLYLITNEVARGLKGAYLQNIYSLADSRRHFLFKFDAPANESGKRFLIVDPGMRYHLTKFQHEPTQQPSHFVQKLRKYLRNRRATDFWIQPGSRLLVITFNDGQYYLVFEFFSGGNIILLNSDHTILTLHRVVLDVGPSHLNYQIGENYPLDMTKEGSALQGMPTREELSTWVSSDKLGKALYSKVSDPSSSMLEYYLREQGLDPKKKLELGNEGRELDNVAKAVELSLKRAHELILSTEPVKGYVLQDEKGNSLEFEPFPEYFNLIHPDNKVVDYPTYNATVDNYFGALISDKGGNKIEQLYELAESRLNAARNEKQKRIATLEQQQQLNERLGNAIQSNAETVDAAIMAVKSLVDQGVDWGDAASLIQLEKEKGNRIAEVIESLNLEQHKVVLLLDDVKVSVYIDRSAHANARDYFEIRRAASAKIEKTEQHSTKALKSAEIKIKRDLDANLAKHRQAGAASKLHSIRQTRWFEKFWWFLTSTNHLVIAAREEMQQTLLLRRYFQDGDIALTSDAPGATLLIVKNPKKQEIPPQTLLQAAAFAVATSAKIWEAKSKAPSWFLTRAQVPKINKKGDPISVNDFRMIKSRIMVPPTPIDMGLALLWQVETPEEKNKTEETNSNRSADSSVDSSDDEDFPDTKIDSDDDFPDTNLDSDDQYSESEAENEAESEGESDESTKDKESVDNDSSENKLESKISELEFSESQSGSTESLESLPSFVDRSHESAKDEEPSSPEQDVSSDKTDTQRTALNVPKKVRGGKKKLRKYMEQDEEDRRAAMERLGTLKGLERKAAERESAEEARRLQLEREEKRRQSRRKAELAFINDTETDSEDQSLPTDLRLKYKEDEPIIAAVPMFAPWSSIQNAQYKAKLVFGSLKKGKASSELLRIILNTATAPPSDCEKLLVDAIKPVDVQQLIAVSRVQIATSTSVKNSSGGTKSKGDPKKKSGNKGSSSSKKKK